MVRSIGTVKSKLAELRNNEIAIAILASIAWTRQSGERDLILEVISKTTRPCSPLEVNAALEQLERIGLLTAGSASLKVSPQNCELLRDLLIQEREAVLPAYEQVIALSPKSPSSYDLLKTLRQEYEFLRPLQPALAKSLGMPLSASPMLLLIESDFALFSTNRQGVRQVDIYRAGETLLGLKAGSIRWKTLRGEERSFIINLCLSVYPTVRGGWRFKRD